MNEIETFVLTLAQSLSDVRRTYFTTLGVGLVWPRVRFDPSLLETYFRQLRQSESEDAATRSELKGLFAHGSHFGRHAEMVKSLWHDCGGLWYFWYKQASLGFRHADYLADYMYEMPLVLLQHEAVAMCTGLDLSSIRSLDSLPADLLRLVVVFATPSSIDIAMARLILWERFVAQDTLISVEGRRMICNAFSFYLTGSRTSDGFLYRWIVQWPARQQTNAPCAPQHDSELLSAKVLEGWPHPTENQ